MHAIANERHTSTAGQAPAWQLHDPADVEAPRTDEVLRRLRDHGGVATGDHLVFLLNDRIEQPISVVAKWIVTRQVISLVHQGQLWLPLIQFQGRDLLPSPDVTAAVQALGEVYNDNGIATWFVSPHPDLQFRWPLHMIDRDASLVVWAARRAAFMPSS